ncbi:MAG: HAD family hydrolase [Chloroflexi bacterium]|nr:HAD family hydrolase [Chloroflexota bacterium]|tara:strand:+ start:6233 stop:6772 length:540 start_codon:yes stop_codon:yes gene_type:complete
MTKRRFVILDRDGTIILERHYLSDPDQIALTEGAVSGLTHLASLGFGFIIVTNQSAIARGFFDTDTLDRIHQRLRTMLRSHGIEIEGIYYCPHHPNDGCSCRKPEPGLLNIAAQEFDFDTSECFVIGDNVCDIELGKRVKAQTILVETGHGKTVSKCNLTAPDYTVANLHEAALIIGNL